VLCHGSKLSGAARHGSLVEIDISIAMLEEMIRTLQRVIDALPWRSGGLPHIYASFYEAGKLST